MNLPPQTVYEALETTRNLLISEDGRREFQNRVGIGGTLSDYKKGCVQPLHRNSISTPVIIAAVALV